MLPRKETIHDQLVALLRDGILNAQWQETLPSEVVLAREFQVSRMTLRKALAHLAAEDWIELGGRGHSHRIRRKPRRTKTSDARTVRLLTPFAMGSWDTTIHLILVAISERLAAAGFRLKIESHPHVFKRHQPARLARLDALPDTAGWILAYANADIQRWFAERDRPTVAIGQVVENLPLSSVYPDAEALARHLAGLLSSRGHRETVYLRAEVTSIGEKIASEMFITESRKSGAMARLVIHDTSMATLQRIISGLLLSRPRPTAIVAGSPDDAITVLCHLLAAGVRVPTDISVISTSDDHHLSRTYPPISRYRLDGRLMGRRIGDAVLRVIQHGNGTLRSIPLMPEFIPGGSLGP